MAYDKLTLVNGACGEIGADPIDVIDEDTPSGRAIALHYDGLLDYCLGLFEWSFATTTRQLSQRGDVTINNGWTKCYALPADRIEDPIKCGPTAVWPRSHFTAYLIEGGDLFCDE